MSQPFKQHNQNTNLAQGLIPPQATDLEDAVLGALLIDTKAAEECVPVISSPNVFYLQKNVYIFAAVQSLFEKGHKIDLLTVSQQLKAMGKLEEVGGDYELIKLTQKVASSAHIEFHSRILVQYYIKRRIIMMNAQITGLCYDEGNDVFDILEKYQNALEPIVDITSIGRRTVSFSDSLDNLKKEIEMLSANTSDVKLVGVTTGFKRTDRHTGGYRKQDLVIIAARPGMGKTAKMLKCVIENVKNDVPVGVFSFEMSAHQLTARAVAIDTHFHLGQLLKSGFAKNEYFEIYDQHASRMKAYPLFIDDSGRNDIADVIMTAKVWKRLHDVKLIVVDYLQLMKDVTVKGNREQEISSISRKLKLLAKELDVPVVALCQLSRAVETRGGAKRPLLSDLRESGSIEQDADIVEFIYRPGYYHIEIIQEDYDDPVHRQAISLGADTEIIYAKYRSGSTGVAMIKWVGDKTKFIDVEDAGDTVNYVEDKMPRMNYAAAFDNTETVFDA